MPTVLITGANRGVGLEFARQYAAHGWRVLATCRDPATAAELKTLAAATAGVGVHPLDVTDAPAIARLADQLRDQPIDLLIGNGALYGPRDRKEFGRIDYAAWAEVMDVNVMGPMRVAEAFVDHLAASERRLLILISSRVAALGEDVTGTSKYIYRSSKAALNAVMKSLAGELAGRGIVVAALHPGHVRTRMGGPGAGLTPEASVAGMRRTIDALSPTRSGGFFNYDGTPIPW